MLEEEEEQQQRADLVNWFYVDNLGSDAVLPAIYKLVAKASNDTYLGLLVEDFGEKGLPPRKKRFFHVGDISSEEGNYLLRLMEPNCIHQYMAEAMKQTIAYAEMKMEEERRRAVSA